MDDAIGIGAVGAVGRSRPEPAVTAVPRPRPAAAAVADSSNATVRRPNPGSRIGTTQESTAGGRTKVTGQGTAPGPGQVGGAKPEPVPVHQPLRPEVTISEYGGPQVEFIDVRTGEPVFSVPSDAALAVIDAALWRVGVRRGSNG